MLLKGSIQTFLGIHGIQTSIVLRKYLKEHHWTIKCYFYYKARKLATTEHPIRDWLQYLLLMSLLRGRGCEKSHFIGKELCLPHMTRQEFFQQLQDNITKHGTATKTTTAPKTVCPLSALKGSFLRVSSNFKLVCEAFLISFKMGVSNYIRLYNKTIS